MSSLTPSVAFSSFFSSSPALALTLDDDARFFFASSLRASSSCLLRPSHVFLVLFVTPSLALWS